MGDRVLIQLKYTDKTEETEISPVAYSHWCGNDTPKILNRLKLRMKERFFDVPYCFARLIQEMCNELPDKDFGVGIFLPPLDEERRVRLLNREESHGDAGIVIV